MSQVQQQQQQQQQQLRMQVRLCKIAITASIIVTVLAPATTICHDATNATTTGTLLVLLKFFSSFLVICLIFFATAHSDTENSSATRNPKR
jgi:uncharacterized membrane protein